MRKDSKVALVLRGVPGSGKSTFVDFVESSNRQVAVHAIDNLHKDHNGDFLWDEENAERLYTLNFANFVRSCADGCPVVICDAINIKVEDFQKYVDIARMYDYTVYVVTANPPTPAQSSKRNKHHTSALQARQMYKQWEAWPSTEMLKELINDDSV